MATASPVNAMATASPDPLASGEAVDENAEEGVSDELRQLPDRALQERLQRLDRGIAVRLPDGGKKYRDHHRALSRELARRQAATCSAPPSPPPHPPHRCQAEPSRSSHPPHRRQGEPDNDRCEMLDQSRCAESSDIQVTSSLPAQLTMEAPVCPSKQLPDVHVIKPKLEACEDSPAPALGAAEDWETTPLSGSHPFFTIVMSRSQVQKPFQLCIPGRFHHRLPEVRMAAVLLCRGKSWAMCYCGDLKVKKLDAEWMRFAVDNQLQVGDACVFELVTDTGSEEEEVVFQVQILRGGLPEEIITKGATADEPMIIVD